MKKRNRKSPPLHETTELRIIGGRLRGSKLLYHGDPITRPMKERVRESIFNLISTEVAGKQVLDLFAGTGALAFEALSRGASSAILIEKHVPTARVIGENIKSLGVEQPCELLTTSAFLWSKRDLPLVADPKSEILNPKTEIPWLVFCSPPYAFFVERQDEMLALIADVLKYAPPASILIVEADERFDFSLLPGGLQQERRGPGWDVRPYPPAVVGVWRCSGSEA